MLQPSSCSECHLWKRWHASSGFKTLALRCLSLMRGYEGYFQKFISLTSCQSHLASRHQSVSQRFTFSSLGDMLLPTTVIRLLFILTLDLLYEINCDFSVWL